MPSVMDDPERVAGTFPVVIASYNTDPVGSARTIWIELLFCFMYLMHACQNNRSERKEHSHIAMPPSVPPVPVAHVKASIFPSV